MCYFHRFCISLFCNLYGGICIKSKEFYSFSQWICRSFCPGKPATIFLCCPLVPVHFMPREIMVVTHLNWLGQNWFSEINFHSIKYEAQPSIQKRVKKYSYNYYMLFHLDSQKQLGSFIRAALTKLQSLYLPAFFRCLYSATFLEFYKWTLHSIYCSHSFFHVEGIISYLIIFTSLIWCEFNPSMG